MAIFLTQNGEPSEFGLAYNDNTYVIKTTNYTPTVRFKISMLPETYPIEPAIGTVRVYPTRADDGGTVYLDRGFFDPSRFLQSYVEGNARIEGASHNGFYTNNKTHKEYFLFIQEEDKNSQGVYVGGDSIFTKLKSVWNGVRNEIEWLDFDYTNYIINTTSTTKKFLTDSPRTIRIDSAQSHQLSFIVNEKYGANQYVVKAYSGYNATGSLLANGVVANTTPSTDWASRYFRIPVGTYDIGNIDPTLYTDSTLGTTPSTALTGAASYTIHLEDNINAQTSEKVTFNINQVCTKYNEVRVHFLNRLGGYDAFNFYLKSIHQTDIKKDKYDQQHHDWNGSRYTYTKKNRGTTDYNVSLKKKLTVNTDYLTEEESVWMEDLITSPSAYIEENNELIAVNLDARRIQRKTSLNDKLMQYTFELSYSIKNRRQRG